MLGGSLFYKQLLLNRSLAFQEEKRPQKILIIICLYNEVRLNSPLKPGAAPPNISKLKTAGEQVKQMHSSSIYAQMALKSENISFEVYYKRLSISVSTKHFLHQEIIRSNKLLGSRLKSNKLRVKQSDLDLSDDLII